MHGYHSFLGVPIVHSVGAYCIRPNMYPAVYMADILYQQELFITQQGRIAYTLACTRLSA